MQTTDFDNQPFLESPNSKKLAETPVNNFFDSSSLTKAFSPFEKNSRSKSHAKN